MFFNGISSCLCLLFEIKGNPYSPVGNNERRAILTSHRRRKFLLIVALSLAPSPPHMAILERSNNLKNRQATGQIQIDKNVFFSDMRKLLLG